MPTSMRLLAVAALAMAQGLAAQDARVIAEWVRLHGGTVTSDAAGSILGVDLRRSWINDIDLERLKGLDRLESLALAQTHVTDSALAILATLPSLRELDLFFCEHITDSGASQIRRAPGLERLNVRGTKISDSGVKFLTELEHLRTLDIGISEIGDPSIELLEAMPHLEALAIGGNRIGEAGIASLKALKRLRHLDLSGAQVTDSGIWTVTVTDLNLDEIGALTGLESLDLGAPSPDYVEAISSGGAPAQRGNPRNRFRRDPPRAASGPAKAGPVPFGTHCSWPREACGPSVSGRAGAVARQVHRRLGGPRACGAAGAQDSRRVVLTVRGCRAQCTG